MSDTKEAAEITSNGRIKAAEITSNGKIKAAEITSNGKIKAILYTTLCKCLMALVLSLSAFGGAGYRANIDLGERSHIKLYSEIYFSYVRADISPMISEKIFEIFYCDMMNGDITKWNDADYLEKKFPNQHEILSQILSEHKDPYNFKNIPDEYVEKINSFFAKKLDNDKNMLTNGSVRIPLKTLSPAYYEAVQRYTREYQDSDSRQRVGYEITGILIQYSHALSKNIDMIYQYVNDCENEFNKSME